MTPDGQLALIFGNVKRADHLMQYADAVLMRADHRIQVEWFVADNPEAMPDMGEEGTQSWRLRFRSTRTSD
jgi:hypothetical protein